jgi:hypothetical protein
MIELAFSWLAEFLGFLGSLIPQIHHQLWIDVGVSITNGDKIKVLKPGLIVYWPFWTEIFHQTATRQTVKIPPLPLLTKDKREVVAGAMVRYTLGRSEKEVKLALIETDDVDSAIIDETLAVLTEFIASRSVDEIQESRTRTNTAITNRVNSRLSMYGVITDRAQLTGFSPGITLCHVRTGENGYHEEEE